MAETKKKAAHTPGPWQQRTLIAQDLHGQQICHSTRWERGAPHPEVAEANARLIAAAPSLLAAAESALRVLSEYGNGTAELSATRELRAAISAATDQPMSVAAEDWRRGLNPS